MIASFLNKVENTEDLREEYNGGPFADVRYLTGEFKLLAVAFNSPFSIQDTFRAKIIKVDHLKSPIQFSIPAIEEKQAYQI